MSYEKSEIKAVETALQAVQGSTDKAGLLLESVDWYGTAAAYEADE